MDIEVLHGDCCAVLATMPENSVDSVVTDPPYELAFMGKRWDATGVAFRVETWAQIYRVLKPGGHLITCGGTRTYHRLACAIEDAGFEIRDSLMWIYGTGFPKSHDVSKGIDKAAGAEREVVGPGQWTGRGAISANGSNEGWKRPAHEAHTDRYETAPTTDAARQWEGWGTALKPAFEPIVLARKPLSESTVAANVLRWGTGAINIKACRVPHGRWPANVCHDGSEEVVELFPDGLKSGNLRGETVNADNQIYGKAGSTLNRKLMVRAGDSGSAARFFYSAKAGKADRAGSKHPTVKPVALMRWLARLITPPGGVVLDPFAGSGTTGAAAMAEGFRCILIERESEYIEDIRRRVAADGIAVCAVS